MKLANRWYILEPYGLVYAYNAEDHHPWEKGLSGGTIHFSSSDKVEDKLGSCGVNHFAQNAWPCMTKGAEPNDPAPCPSMLSTSKV